MTDDIQDAQIVPDEPENYSGDNNPDNEEQLEDSTVSSSALANVPSSEIAKLDTFNNVNELKRFAIEMGIPGSPESVAQRILRGRELGVGAMASFDNIYILNGRGTLSVHLVNSLLKKAGYEIRTIRDNMYLQKDGTFMPVKTDNSVDRCCTIEFAWRSKLTGEVLKEEYTYWWSEAVAAKLTTKATWIAYSKQLLWNRTLVFGARRVAAEVLMGMYEYSEIADMEGKDYTIDEQGSAKPIDISPKQ